jgi:hypothetical protein
MASGWVGGVVLYDKADLEKVGLFAHRDGGI